MQELKGGGGCDWFTFQLMKEKTYTKNIFLGGGVQVADSGAGELSHGLTYEIKELKRTEGQGMQTPGVEEGGYPSLVPNI